MGSMKARILFVDDEANVLEGLRRSLRAYSETWELSFAGSAEEALGKLATIGFDTIVSDIWMPGKDGFTLLEEIRSQPRTQDIPVIILTGRQERDLKRRALDLGATDLLNKPIEREDLIARLRSTLRLKVYQDELRVQNAILDQKVWKRTQELAASRLEIVWCLGKAAEFRDEGTGNHIVRVGCYCRAIAEALGMPKDFVELLFLASPLHDIGKIGIPDHILLKPGKLTRQERQIMQTHCAIGARILREDSKTRMLFYAWQPRESDGLKKREYNPLLEMAANIALMHHERCDGTGYPQGLTTAAIPLEASIVALADVYDALCSERPYKRAYPESQALDIIRATVGRQFDPFAYSGFERALDMIRDIQAQFPDRMQSGCRKAAA